MLRQMPLKQAARPHTGEDQGRTLRMPEVWSKDGVQHMALLAKIDLGFQASLNNHIEGILFLNFTAE